MSEKSVSIRYFAALREQAGCSQEQLLTCAANPAGLYAELQARYGFRLGFDQLRVAVNDRFSSPTIPLDHGDQIAFIPPVSGG
ncbi:MAG: molybdopterin synthase sulfur carrier subunit [Candidatus Melainabacteria bacterium HGW-Melainabacteria-1]|nr:MAG: molybdopterin synthase sulfur carrier subunit [Candidatus Melainabacteria bacterium HGW-Melainabacteria-1]